MDTTSSDKTPRDPDDKAEGEMKERAGPAKAAFNHPKALAGPIALIERLLAKDADPKAGIDQLCERTLANPDALIEAAGNYLAHLQTSGQLLKCPDIPPAFLVEELAQGVVNVSPLIVSHWVEAGDTARLARLADGLMDQASRLHGAEVGGFILNVAVPLAIQKPVRSQRLIEIARPLVEDDGKHPLVCKAVKWQAAGEFLRDDGRTFRSFWQKHLAGDAAADWESEEAKEAVAHLHHAREEGKEIPALFLEAMPSEAPQASADEAKDTRSAGEEQTPAPDLAKKEPPVLSASDERTLRTRARARAGFFPGLLVGGSLSMLAAAAWLWKSPAPPVEKPPETTMQQQGQQPASESKKPGRIVEQPRPATPKPPVVSPQTMPPAAPVALVATAAPAKRAEVRMPPPPPAAPPAVMIKPKIEPPPPEQMKHAVTTPDRPEDAWRKAEFAALGRQHPELLRWHEAVRTSKWSKSRSLVMGMESYLLFSSDEYPHFITLLLLDPPDDAEVAEAVAKISARRLKPMEAISLWEKLVYPGSPNEKEVREAADGYLSVKRDVLVPAAVERLQKIAGKPATSPRK